MTLPVDDASVWFENQFIDAAVMQTNLVDPINELDDRTADSGWQTVTAASGFTGVSFQAKLIGTRVYLRGRVNKNSGNYTAGDYTTVGTLPSSDYEPAVDVREKITSADSDVAGVLRVDAGSTSVQVYAPTGSTVAGYYVPGTWDTV